jgi:membrane protein DedA with SNARE-associated domain
VTAIVRDLGPLGVFLLMVPESACIPVPSEVTLAFSGFAVTQGLMSFPVAVLAATAGNLVGSLLVYALARTAFVRRLEAPGPLASCERMLARRGDSAVFLARLLPLARTFVSVPAGRAGVPLGHFVVLTAAGCALWACAFVLLGMVAGSAWETAGTAVGRGLLALTVLAGLTAVGRAAVRRRTAG